MTHRQIGVPPRKPCAHTTYHPECWLCVDYDATLAAEDAAERNRRAMHEAEHTHRVMTPAGAAYWHDGLIGATD